MQHWCDGMQDELLGTPYRHKSASTVLRRGWWAIALLCALWAIPAHAQTPSVTETADRPGFSDSPVLLGRGRVQIESGFMVEREDDGPKSTRTLTWPQAELHTGVNTHLDFSVTWDGLITTTDLTSTSSGETRTTGGADVRLGAKLGLVNRPHVDAALIGYVFLPVGSASVSADTLIRSRAWLGVSPSRIALDFRGRPIWEPCAKTMVRCAPNRRPVRRWQARLPVRWGALSVSLPNRRSCVQHHRSGRPRQAWNWHSARDTRSTSGLAGTSQAAPAIGS